MLIQDIALAFERNKYQIYKVGGCVRDEVLKRPITDIDLTTSAKPEETLTLLRKYFSNYSSYTIGEKFGTVGLITPEGNIEITTFRDEVYPANSRKPEVVFGNDLYKDLSRRDFTINSLCQNVMTEEILDYFNGLDDIKAKVIRCVGNEDRLNEDPLRMMRMIRFACQLNFAIASKITNPERLKIISQERIRDELVKILLSPNPAYGIDKLYTTGLMKYIIPEFEPLYGLSQGKHHIKDAYGHTLLAIENTLKYDFEESNLLLRLTALLHDIAKPKTYSRDLIVETNNDTKTSTFAEGEIHFYEHQTIGAKMAEEILIRLRFDSEIIKRVKTLIENHMSVLMLDDKDINERNIRRLIRRLGDENIDTMLAFVACDTKASSNERLAKNALLSYWVQAVRREKPCEMKSPLTGEEIMSLLGIAQGKLVGDIKEYLLNKVIDGEILETDKEKAEKIVIDLFGDHRQ